MTFEETRAQILDGLARPIATAKQQAALSKVHEVMSKHFLAQNAYQSQVKAGKKVEAPETPDIKKLAEELGLKYSRTGFIDVLSSQGMPIAQSSAGEIFAQGQSFFSIAFTDKTPLLYPQQTSNFFAGESYVFWKLEERQAYVPTLAEARDEVVATLRRQKARELAKEAADKFRRDAAGSDKPMVELVPETRRNLVQEKVGPFTWMQSFNMRQAPNVSNLPSLDRAGEEFMKNVFATASGQYAVAPNETESVFYVVKVLERKPDEATLRQAFMNATSRLPTQPLTESEYLNLRSSWLSDLEDRYGLKLVE